MRMKIFSLKLRLGIIAALIILVYWPTFVWMKARFFESNSYYSHGILIPVVFFYLLWIKCRGLKEIQLSPSRAGLFILIPALLIHLLAYFFEINFISGFSLAILLFGLSVYLYGWGISRKILFPILFLLFMIPLPQVMIISVSFTMKVLAAKVAAAGVNFMGIAAIREGSAIYLPNGAFLNIGDPCSGLRSLVSLTALGALYAYISKISMARKSVLFLLSIPIALFANIARIVLLLIVAFVYGSDVAAGKFHDFSGFLLFVFALAGLMAAGRILSWKKEI